MLGHSCGCHSLFAFFPYHSLAPIINTHGPQTAYKDLSQTPYPLTHRFSPPTTRIGSQRDDPSSPLSWVASSKGSF